MKKGFALVLAATVCLFCLMGCGSTSGVSSSSEAQPVSAQSSDTATAPLAGQHFKVGLSANFKFFETVTVGSDGKEYYEGTDIDILNHLSEKLGFTYEISNMPFASLIGALQAKQVDFVISGMSATEERAKSVDFSQSYVTASLGVLTKEGSDIKSIADLNGKKIACSQGTSYEKVIKSIPGAELVTFDGQAAVTQELMMGRVDACMTSGTGCKKIASENTGLTYFIVVDEIKGMESSVNEFAMAFPKGSALKAVMNTEISNMKNDGTLKSILVKWLGEDQAKFTPAV